MFSNKVVYGKCSKITNTKILIYFFAVRNFRNYVSEKVLVFVVLECGLYFEQKRYICMSKCGRNVLKTRRYDSALSSHFSFQPPPISCGLSL